MMHLITPVRSKGLHYLNLNENVSLRRNTNYHLKLKHQLKISHSSLVRQSQSPFAFSPRCSLNPPVHLLLTRTNPATLISYICVYSFFILQDRFPSLDVLSQAWSYN